MAGKTRARFGAVSLLYVTAVGVLAGNFLDQTGQLLEGAAHPGNLRHGSPVFQAAALAGALTVVVLQTLRVLASRRRARLAGGDDHPLTAGEFFGGLQWNLQAKCLLLLLLVWGAAEIKQAL